MEPTPASAEQLLSKLRVFAVGLASEERALLGALVAPGLAGALGGGSSRPSTSSLPAVLGEALGHQPDVLADLGTDVISPPADDERQSG